MTPTGGGWVTDDRLQVFCSCAHTVMWGLIGQTLHPASCCPARHPLQVIQQRLAALEEDNHKEDDFAAGSDDEEFELPKGSDEGGSSRKG